MTIQSISVPILVALLLTACAGPSSIERQTLQKVDTGNNTNEIENSNNITPKSDNDIRKAYENYLRYAAKSDLSRGKALTRLAELEFELSEKIFNNESSDIDKTLENKRYHAKLDKTIALLTTSLRDYPKAKGNDKTLYQLAKAYDQKGNYDQTNATIKKLVEQYPKSKYYIESQFRLAENAFSKKKYPAAEDYYTAIIGSKKSSIFYEKSLYKRGWSRLKQTFYAQAVDDFLHVVNLNQFDPYSELSQPKKELFNDYFRAIGLAFSYLGGTQPINEYFKDQPNFEHLYYTYLHLTDIYLKEERNNDAVNTLTYFVNQHPDSDHSPEAALNIISIWKKSGFTSKMNAALKFFYITYQPDSQYWRNQKNIDKRVQQLVNTNLRNHILTATRNYHKKYQLTRKQDDFLKAQKWYKNYLKHYEVYSRKDHIHYLYATLLAENKNDPDALLHYEFSAYDSDIIINKDAAYETILLTSKLFTSTDSKKTISPWLKKLIHYSTLYSQQYPNDNKTIPIISHVSELAYNGDLFKETIALAGLIAGNNASTAVYNINTIKAHSYVKLKQYEDAEDTYSAILKNQNLSPKKKPPLLEGLALAIYFQGKSAIDQKTSTEAIQHYARIADIAPDTKIAATGLYDAITLAMQNEQWAQSIGFITSFQRLYPAHKYSHDISKKLSVAYLNSKQDIKAAKTLEQLSKQDQDKDYSIAALWKAGELYESNQDYNAAIRSYKQYSKNFSRPFPQYMEAMFKLVELYTIMENRSAVISWQNNIVRADKKASISLKTDRTMFIASTINLHLAQASYLDFKKIKLALPLKKNLKKKKQAMQRAVTLYGRAASYRIAEIATEATHSIGDIFNQFNNDLLQSERPLHLDENELQQYQFLLEDQAFPFEEKAIEFYEINLTHVKDNIYNEWVQKSHIELKELFPVRYQREIKLDGYVNVLH